MANIRKSFNFRNGVQVDNDKFVVNPNGLVGIGTTIPRQVLDVRGQAQIIGVATATELQSNQLLVSGVGTISNFSDGTLTIQSGIISAVAGGIVTYRGDGSGLVNIPTSQWVDIDVGLGYTSIFARSANVGIGTTDPRHSLQIGGNPDIVGHQGIGIGSIRGDVKTTGIITAHTFHGNLRASDLTGVIDDARLPNLITSNIQGNVTGDLTGTADFARNLTGSPNTLVGVITATSVHTTRLDVSGIGTINNLVATTQASVGTGTAFIALNTGKVGIGTLEPSAELQIRRADGAAIEVISEDGISRISLGQRAGAGNSTGVIRYGQQNDTFDFINNSTGDMRFIVDANPAGINTGNITWHHQTPATTLMTLTYQGSLGINDTNPSEKLAVGGGITVAQNSFFDGTVTANAFVGNGAGLTNIALPNPITVNSFNQTGVSTFGEIHVFNNTGVGNPLTVGLSSIGISTQSPIAGVDARRDIGMFSRIALNQDSINGISGPVQAFDIRLDDIRLDCEGTIKTRSIGIGGSARSGFDMGQAINEGGAYPALIVASVSETQRNNITDRVSGGSTVTGSIVYNTDVNQFQGYNGSVWSQLGSGAAGGIAGINTLTNSFFNNVNISGILTAGVGTVRSLQVGSGMHIDVPDGQLAVLSNPAEIATFTVGQNVDGTGANHFGLSYGAGEAQLFTSNGNMRFVVDGGGGGAVPLAAQASFQYGFNGNFGNAADVEFNAIDVAAGVSTALLVRGNARVTGIMTVGFDSIIIDGNRNEISIGTGVTLTSSGNSVYSGIVTASQFVRTGGTSAQFLMADGSVSTAGASGIAAVVDDTTPQLGGNLDLNGNDITGIGSANFTGVVTATSFSGSGSNLTGLTGAAANTYGNATAVAQITVDANGRITNIQNVSVSGGGGGGSADNLVEIRASDAVVGSAGTINVGAGLTVSNLSVGIVTISLDEEQVQEEQQVGVGTFGVNNPGDQGNVTVGGAQTAIVVNGDARVTGILTVGTETVTINGPTNTVSVNSNTGMGVTILGNTGVITATGAFAGPADLYLHAGEANGLQYHSGVLSIGSTDNNNNGQFKLLNLQGSAMVELESNGANPADGRVRVNAFGNGGAAEVSVGSENPTNTGANGANLTGYGHNVTSNAARLTLSSNSQSASQTMISVATAPNAGTSKDLAFQVNSDGSMDANSPASTWYFETESLSQAWEFTKGPTIDGNTNNPELTVIRGQRYRFYNKNNVGGQAFRIQSDPNGTVAGTIYNDGITNNDATGQVQLVWEVQADAPDVLYYQSTTTAIMGGKINVIGGAPSSPVSKYVLGANGTTDYTFTGPGLTGAENDPTLFVIRGQRYQFENGNSSGAHPFRIQSDTNGATGTQYNDGVTNQDASGGTTLFWDVQHDAPDTLFYQCTSHPNMGGRINVLNVGSGSGIPSRETKSGTTGSVGAGLTTTLDITGYKSYGLLKIETDKAAWVRLYTDSTSRTNDQHRSAFEDIAPGSGLIAEVSSNTSGSNTFKMSPGVIGWNDDGTPSTTIYASVTNNESTSQTITVDLTLLQMES